jgi:hypothetical protein
MNTKRNKDCEVMTEPGVQSLSYSVARITSESLAQGRDLSVEQLLILLRYVHNWDPAVAAMSVKRPVIARVRAEVCKAMKDAQLVGVLKSFMSEYYAKKRRRREK